jgi:hypothetical protein
MVFNYLSALINIYVVFVRTLEYSLSLFIVKLNDRLN